MRKGQVLAVVLLIVAVVATVGLSVASRSVTEVKVSSTQEESARALEAAEIGLERYVGGLITPTPGARVNIAPINAGFYIPNPQDIGGGNYIKVPYDLVEGDIATIDLPPCTGVGGDRCNQFRVCWGSDTAGPDYPKIEIEFFYLIGGAPNPGAIAVRRAGLDPYTASPLFGFLHNETPPYLIQQDKSCGTTETFRFGTRDLALDSDTNDVNLNLGLLADGKNNLLFARIRMLGNEGFGEPVAIQIAGARVPIQGGDIVTVGEAGQSVQKIKAKVMYYDLPPMFDSAVFSGTSLP